MEWRIREGEYELYVEPCVADEYGEFMGDLGKVPTELANRFFEACEACRKVQVELHKFWTRAAEERNRTWRWRKTAD